MVLQGIQCRIQSGAGEEASDADGENTDSASANYESSARDSLCKGSQSSSSSLKTSSSAHTFGSHEDMGKSGSVDCLGGFKEFPADSLSSRGSLNEHQDSSSVCSENVPLAKV